MQPSTINMPINKEMPIEKTTPDNSLAASSYYLNKLPLSEYSRMLGWMAETGNKDWGAVNSWEGFSPDFVHFNSQGEKGVSLSTAEENVKKLMAPLSQNIKPLNSYTAMEKMGRALQPMEDPKNRKTSLLEENSVNSLASI